MSTSNDPVGREIRVGAAALLAASVVLADLPAAASVAPANQAGAARELRGVWIAAADEDFFRSRESIAEGLEFLARHHFNVVFPDVWYRGVTLHPSALLERTFGVRQDPRYAGRDPLAEVLVEAHRRGIEVIPWFEYGFAASNAAQPTPLLDLKPEWAARDRDGRVATKQAFAWMNAFDPAVQEFVAGLVLEVARGYDVDGVQGDDRLPALPSTAGYDELTAGLWRKERRLAPPLPGDPRWIEWRAGRLTDFLARLARDVRGSGDGVLYSASPSPWRSGLDEYLQDSKTWLERGLVDLFHPQCYRRDFESYQRLADEQRALIPRHSRTVYAPGILIESGSWRIAPAELVKLVEHGRERGFDGEVLFHFAGLRADDGRLARALLAGPYAERARQPHRAGTWRPVAPESEPRAAGGAQGFVRERGHLRATAPGAAEVHYSLAARTAGWYALHVEFPAGVELPARVACAASADVEPVERIVPRPGLVQVAHVRLGARAPTSLSLSTAADEARPLVAGRAVLILDRKRSPGALWRD
ncbi:MAG: family 10 glycosylhydrolase [Planctomycetes bacterium]|nr:family 10 glycosylhydrolase [Planctomycetota bacterium]